ncbi:unnamed protein product [Urochloa decumbens]|uniref:DUF569 domain-containing protein n=1 Tax=Urochloa decumbens TaxID=240449 RepID=A0ABC9DTS3_9POAL
MEFFLDGWCVRLRSRQHGYIHAADDGVGISMRPERASLNAAWMVERLQRGGINYALLRGAAYGRYLALVPAQPGLLRCGVVQRPYEDPEQDDVLWEVAPVRAEERGGDVFIRHCRQTPSYLGVAVGNNVDPTPSTYWMVDVLFPRLVPPALPAPPPFPVVLLRLIAYVLGNDLGNFEQNAFQQCLFFGRSVYELRTQLAGLLNFANSNDITLCVKAGSQGRLTHMVVDLPDNEDSMDIVVLRTTSTEYEVVVVAPRC